MRAVSVFVLFSVMCAVFVMPAVAQTTAPAPVSAQSRAVPGAMGPTPPIEKDAPIIGENGELLAPFVADEGDGDVEGGGFLDDLYAPVEKSTVALDQPHRHVSQIADWLEDILARSLTMEKATLDEHEEEIRAYMHGLAWAHYNKFVEGNKVRLYVERNGLDLKSYVDSQPLLINEGVVDGRYRWLFEVPMTMTFIKSGVTSYEQARPVNWYVKIKAQVGRVSEGVVPEGDLQIDTWDIETLPARGQ